MFLSPIHGKESMHQFRRTGIAVVAASVAVLGASMTGVPGASADSSSSPSFVAGSANATSQAITIAPATGGLGYDITLAQSVADYQGTQGQAHAQTLNLGAIGLSLTSEGCDGSAPTVSSSQLPQPAVAESNDGNQTQTKTLSQGSTGVAYGVETASATTQPSGDANATASGFGVPGVFQIGGGVATAHSALVDNKTREAIGTASVGTLSLPGGVTLKHLDWNATQRTGANATQSGTFTVGSLQIGPASLPVSPDSLAQAFAVVNQALASSGFHVTPPALVKNPDGSIAETPLSIGIDSSALGQQVLGPLLGAAQPLRSALASALLGISCKTSTPLLLSDIAIGPLAGGGNLDLELGGATANSNGTAYGNPFGSGSGGDQLTANPASSAPALSSGSASDFGSQSSGSTGSSAQSSGSTSSGATQLAVSKSTRCVTTSPFGHPSCSRGAALPVALAGLVLVGGMGVADWVRSRRRIQESI
jgi:hypothetical protein